MFCKLCMFWMFCMLLWFTIVPHHHTIYIYDCKRVSNCSNVLCAGSTFLPFLRKCRACVFSSSPHWLALHLLLIGWRSIFSSLVGAPSSPHWLALHLLLIGWRSTFSSLAGAPHWLVLFIGQDIGHWTLDIGHWTLVNAVTACAPFSQGQPGWIRQRQTLLNSLPQQHQPGRGALDWYRHACIVLLW